MRTCALLHESIQTFLPSQGETDIAAMLAVGS
jgi:hypothetical protein